MLFSSLQHVLEISTVTTDNYRELRGEIKKNTNVILDNAKRWAKAAHSQIIN